MLTREEIGGDSPLQQLNLTSKLSEKNLGFQNSLAQQNPSLNSNLRLGVSQFTKRQLIEMASIVSSNHFKSNICINSEKPENVALSRQRFEFLQI